MCGGIHILQAKTHHQIQIIKLIDQVYHEYNYKVNTQKYDKDLLNIEKYYFSKGGYFWIAVHKKEIIGTIAVKPFDNQSIEIKRLYLKKECRGSSVAHRLCQKAYTFAYEKNFREIILWSDVKFKRAHSFYLKRNFTLCGKRKKYDADEPYQEYCFKKVLDNNLFYNKL